MGVTLKTKPKAPHDDALEIMPANWNSVMTFLDVQTQWDISVSMAGLIWRGLRYSDVMHVIDDTGAAPGVFADIRVMEAAALPILNSAAD